METSINTKLVLPFLCLVVGSSGCGKMYFVKNVLEQCVNVLDAVPDNIVWIYTSFQPMHQDLSRAVKKINFVTCLS